jgi:uncharacterized protein YndB with AHSA1/START domain
MSIETTEDREIVITRVINAPRPLVFDTWLDHGHISDWWGPRGFRTTTHASSTTVGGLWRFTMHGPDGRDYENLVQFTEIQRPERLKYRHGTNLESPEEFLAEITFDEDGDKTFVTLRMICHTVADCANMRQFGAIEGGHDTLARLEEHLSKVAG